MQAGLAARPLVKGREPQGFRSFRNKLINGGFNVNQRGASGTVNLGAGAYGHDRWKAGAAGCTYTFATVGDLTTITIQAGSLIQVIEDRNVEGGSYTVSGVGSAPGRVVGGTYAALPFQLTGVPGGSALPVEFGVGTLREVQLEPGLVQTPFERRLYGTELSLCQRYYYRMSGSPLFGLGQVTGNSAVTLVAQHPVAMRTGPTTLDANAIVAYTASLVAVSANSAVLGSVSPIISSVNLAMFSASFVAGNVSIVSGVYLGFGAEL